MALMKKNCLQGKDKLCWAHEYKTVSTSSSGSKLKSLKFEGLERMKK
jgi:hypothetical protein